MDISLPSPSSTMSLKDVLESLQGHPNIIGLLLDGSLAKNKLSPASDYDIVIIMDNFDLPIHVGFTVIDGRPADIVVLQKADIQAVIDTTLPVDPNHHVGHLIRRLKDAQLIYDREGQLQVAVDKANQENTLTMSSDHSAYSAWFGLNFNLAHLRLLRKGTDDVRRITAEIRMTIYGAPELLWRYFEIRHIIWTGEKEAVRYLQANDPDYLQDYLMFLRETDDDEKFKLYEQLVDKASQPMGGRWQENHSYWILDDDEKIDEARKTRLRHLWRELLGD